MTNVPSHIPVLLTESLALLDVRRGGAYVDATTGLGGHSEEIATRMGDTGRLLCIDQDVEALEFARRRLAPFGRRVSFRHENFRELARVAAEEDFGEVDGVLMDLGVSSLQFGAAERGFMFGQEGPLDMRMDARSELTAAEIVNQWPQEEIANLIFRYGEERQSRRIAAAIVHARPLQTTWDLARAVEQAVGGARGRTLIHPATKVFLALRIRVNGELDSLDAALPQAHSLLGPGTATTPGGRLVIISFHSLEDRAVKQYFRRESTDCICPPELPVCRCGHRATLRELTRKAVRPTEQEVAANPRSRSAVLRAAHRIGP
jgi:16S rRNA (cytosine1402-N4)-methyltransferase